MDQVKKIRYEKKNKDQWLAIPLTAYQDHHMLHYIIHHEANHLYEFSQIPEGQMQQHLNLYPRKDNLMVWEKSISINTRLNGFYNRLNDVIVDKRTSALHPDHYPEQYRQDIVQTMKIPTMSLVEDGWTWEYTLINWSWVFSPTKGTHRLMQPWDVNDRSQKTKYADAFAMYRYRRDTFPEWQVTLPNGLDTIINESPSGCIVELKELMKKEFAGLLREYPEKFADKQDFVATYNTYIWSLAKTYNDSIKPTRTKANKNKSRSKISDMMDDMLMMDATTPVYSLPQRTYLTKNILEPIMHWLILLDIAKGIAFFDHDAEWSEQVSENPWWNPYLSDYADDDNTTDSIPQEAFDTMMQDQQMPNNQWSFEDFFPWSDEQSSEWWETLDTWWFSLPSIEDDTPQIEPKVPSRPIEQKPVYESPDIPDLTPEDRSNYQTIKNQYAHLTNSFIEAFASLLKDQIAPKLTTTTRHSKRWDMLAVEPTITWILADWYLKTPVFSKKTKALETTNTYKDMVMVLMVDVSRSMNQYKQGTYGQNPILNGLVMALREAIQHTINVQNINADCEILLYTSKVDFMSFDSNHPDFHNAEIYHQTTKVNKMINSMSWWTNDSTARSMIAHTMKNKYFTANPEVLDWLISWKTKGLFLQISDGDVVDWSCKWLRDIFRGVDVSDESILLRRIIIWKSNAKFPEWKQVIVDPNTIDVDAITWLFSQDP